MASDRKAHGHDSHQVADERTVAVVLLKQGLVRLERERSVGILGRRNQASLPESVGEFRFGEGCQMVLPVLGMTFLQPKPTFAAASTNGDERSPRFEGREGEKRAHAVEADDEFVVLADSPARREGHQNWTTYRGQRDGLVESGKLIPSDDPQYYVFADHVGFASPSAAAAVIAAGNRNGRTYWKVEGTGQTYGMAGGEAAGSGGGEWGGRRRVKT